MRRVIFTCANRGWIDQARVTVRSIQENCNGADVYVFTNQTGFTGIDLNTIKFGKVNGAPDPVLVQIEVQVPPRSKDQDALAIPEDSMCLRMKALAYLKELGYDVAVYMDADALMLRPFPESFWKQENGAVEDLLIKAYNGRPIYADRLKKGYMKSYIYNKGYHYFNSGVLRADLHSEVWADSFERYLEYRTCPLTPYGICLDQDFLNQLLMGDYESLPLEYNMHIWYQDKYSPIQHNWLSKTETLDDWCSEMNTFIQNSVIVLHYAAATKPWMKPNANKVGAWKLSMVHYWNDIASRTEGITEKKIARIAETNVFMEEHNQFRQKHIEPKESPSVCQVTELRQEKTFGLDSFL